MAAAGAGRGAAAGGRVHAGAGARRAPRSRLVRHVLFHAGIQFLCLNRQADRFVHAFRVACAALATSTPSKAFAHHAKQSHPVVGTAKHSKNIITAVVALQSLHSEHCRLQAPGAGAARGGRGFHGASRGAGRRFCGGAAGAALWRARQRRDLGACRGRSCRCRFPCRKPAKRIFGIDNGHRVTRCDVLICKAYFGMTCGR